MDLLTETHLLKNSTAFYKTCRFITEFKMPATDSFEVSEYLRTVFI